MASIQPPIAEIKELADIRHVYRALGGPKLRGKRGPAFWRGGTHFSVSLDPCKGLWCDHAAGEGGDVVALVRRVRECGFLEAAAWLAEHTGVRVSAWTRQDRGGDNDWPTDLRFATWWAAAAAVLADEALECLPWWSLERREPTALLKEIRQGGAALVDEYREWRRRFPALTAAMTKAGRRGEARVQRRLAVWLRGMVDEQTAE
jgi:hypothetical protein